jgi:flagellar motor switch protein FliM
VLDEVHIPLVDALNLKPGYRVMLNATADSLVELRCGEAPLFVGRMGQRDGHIAVRVEDRARRKKRAP